MSMRACGSVTRRDDYTAAELLIIMFKPNDELAPLLPLGLVPLHNCIAR